MKNKIAKTLFIIGVLTIIVGGVVGIYLMMTDFTGVMFFISSVVSGIFVIGFSEIIKLLDEINSKLEKTK
ncbi:hypothetical protein DS745_01350 [Anaerobacillus alkaliphilus]|uniref:Uncharacterized protein n=1 Tax=Anaerobacillus alkaliphilus TaxID=1548597 RepID=A0A4Q0VWH4_9BACI|nr:hypothetical protein [Anaerobacillus alkaliphilus]RXJ04063.1 hypothetical protein DS745_01350 [Anaerobacillus alkaliphilus]